MCKNITSPHVHAAPPALLEAVRRGDELTALRILNTSQTPVDVDGIENVARDGTALFWAACRGLSAVAVQLLETGSSTGTRTKSGCTPLHGAADRGMEKLITILLRHKADVRSQNFGGNTPAHLAAYRGNTGCLRLLLETDGSDPYIRNNEGKTVFQTAYAEGHAETIKFLEDLQRMWMQEKQRDRQLPEYELLHHPQFISGQEQSSPGVAMSRTMQFSPSSPGGPQSRSLRGQGGHGWTTVSASSGGQSSPALRPSAHLLAHGPSPRRVVIETLQQPQTAKQPHRTLGAGKDVVYKQK